MSAADSLPDDVETLKAMLIAAQAACLEAQAKARNAEAEARARALLIEQMKFTIAKLRHERFGQSSERGAVLEQLELRLADMEEDASEAEAAAQMAADAAAREKIEVQAFHRRKPARRPLSEHLPRERIVYPGPSSCPCCGGVLPARRGCLPGRGAIHASEGDHVREFSCRSCETITQPPARRIRSRVGARPGLLAHICAPNTGTSAAHPKRGLCARGIELDAPTLAGGSALVLRR